LAAEGGQVPALVPDRGGQGGPVQGGEPAIREQPAVVRHDVPHVGGPGGVDQMGVGVVEGSEVGLIHLYTRKERFTEPLLDCGD